MTHWLNMLYEDFKYQKIAGGNIPCNSCKYINECREDPPTMINKAIERIVGGEKVDILLRTKNT